MVVFSVTLVCHVLFTLFSWIKWAKGYEDEAWYRLLAMILANSIILAAYGMSFFLILEDFSYGNPNI